jgi:TusA-related sulfurtransferase
MITVDARGLSCPEPVIQVRNALEISSSGAEIEVLVETVTSRENVLRVARTGGCEVGVEEIEDGFRLSIRKP